jgi:hypothetical protein
MWSPSSTLNNSAFPNPLSTPPQTTNYSLSVIDSIGCAFLVPDQVVVTVTPLIIVKTNPSVFGGDNFQLIASPGATNYSWNPGVGLTDPFFADPVLTVTSDVAFHIIATTAAGCRGDGKVIAMCTKTRRYMPTGFTPNGDGKK